MTDDIRQMVDRMVEELAKTTFEPNKWWVHPRERAWIVDPQGPAPSVNAINVALGAGAIDSEHPEVQRLFRRLRGEELPDA